MEVGLVDVAALRRHQRGAFTGGEAMGSMVEADEPRCALRRQSDLGSEPGPELLSAPSDAAGQLVDPDLSPAGLDPRRR
jgi:hypothetical protein